MQALDVPNLLDAVRANPKPLHWNGSKRVEQN
jgi:hypothetical protein